MKFKTMVEQCDEQVNDCPKCKTRTECIALQRSGIPKPYQYKHIHDASILKADVEQLLNRNRSLK